MVYSQWWIPPNRVNAQQTWVTWYPGIQYAFADGKADVVQGVWPVEVRMGSHRVYIQEDAWGNCTTQAWFSW